MEIRATTLDDVPAVMAVFEDDRAFMREHGNMNQWPVGTPSRETVLGDVANGTGYVAIQGGRVVGTFAFIPGEDPTYAVIKGEGWRYDEPYCAIHRVASLSSVHGMVRALFAFCKERSDYLRIDTHEDNIPMQNAILKHGFEPCGEVYLANGDPRIAFDWHR